MSKLLNKKKENRIIAVIPARGGSKGVLGKNIKLLAGYPLIAYSVIASKLSSQIERTIVSTDSQEIADIAVFYGAEVPFLRPEEFAADKSPDIEFIRHLIGWLKGNESFCPEYIVHLRPTTPLREPELINHAIEQLIDHKEATSLRSVHETQEPAYKLLGIKDDFLEGLFPADKRPEYYNLPRQMFPPTFYPNGYVDIIKSEVVLSSASLHGNKILSFVTPDMGELDRLEDFDYIEFILSKKGNVIFEFLKNNFKLEK